MSSFLAGFTASSIPLYRGIPLTTESIFTHLPPVIDIGANLLDEMYSGVYNDKQRHDGDLDAVLQRGRSCNVRKVICTAGTVKDSQSAYTFSKSDLGLDYNIYSTVGIHPTRCNEFGDTSSSQSSLGCEVIQNLKSIVDRDTAESNGDNDGEKRERRIVAIGECGLDYARLKFCSREQQIVGFQKQLDLAEVVQLPMFLHNRDTEGEFINIITQNIAKLPKGGVVHSFDGTLEEMEALTSLGLYIGINGCSLRTPESLEVVKCIPLDRLLLETDAPWCGIKNTHPGAALREIEFPNLKKKEKYIDGHLVKDRNEPCMLQSVLEVVAAVRGVDKASLAEAVFKNTERLFFYTGEEGGKA